MQPIAMTEVAGWDDTLTSRAYLGHVLCEAIRITQYRTHLNGEQLRKLMMLNRTAFWRMRQGQPIKERSFDFAMLQLEQVMLGTR